MKVVQPKVTDKLIREMIKANPHGARLLVYRNGLEYAVLTSMNNDFPAESLLRAGDTAILHSRIVSTGKICPEQLHLFPLNGGCYNGFRFAHNGTANEFTSYGDGWDSRGIARVLESISTTSSADCFLEALATRTYSKFILVSPSGDARRYGSWSLIENGFVSNLMWTYNPKTKTYYDYDDCAFYESDYSARRARKVANAKKEPKNNVVGSISIDNDDDLNSSVGGK